MTKSNFLEKFPTAALSAAKRKDVAVINNHSYRSSEAEVVQNSFMSLLLVHWPTMNVFIFYFKCRHFYLQKSILLRLHLDKGKMFMQIVQLNHIMYSESSKTEEGLRCTTTTLIFYVVYSFPLFSLQIPIFLRWSVQQHNKHLWCKRLCSLSIKPHARRSVA